MQYFRGLLGATIGASRLTGSSGKTAPNPAKPSVVDFRADVMKTVTTKLPKDISLERFTEAYVTFDSEDAIEKEVHAHTVLGDRRYSVEQRVGEEFVKRGIYPVGRGYFHAQRARVK